MVAEHRTEYHQQQLLPKLTGFNYLVHRYYDGLMRIARLTIEDETVAADVVQDVLLHANQLTLQNHSIASVTKRINYWLEAAISQWRAAQQLHEQPAARARYQLMANQSVSLEEKMIAWELHCRLHIYLAQLPTKLRVTMMMREVGGFSYQEIARNIGCPIGTVRSRIARAKCLLISALKNDQLLPAATSQNSLQH